MPLEFTIIAGQTTETDTLELKKIFNKAGGIIGRHINSDWHLPDEKLYISNKHAIISFIDNNYFFIDNSSNGTYIKHPYAKLEKGEIQIIHNNDVFIIGHYEIQARLFNQIDDEVYKSEEKLPQDIQNIIPDDYLLVEDQILDPLELTSEIKPVNTENLESLELLSVLNNTNDSAKETEGEIQGKLSIVNERVVASQLKEQYEFDDISKVDDQINEEQNLFQAYFSSLGYDNNQENQTMESQVNQLKEYGEITKILLESFLNIVNARTSIKNELKLPQTTIQQSSNNPFKFSLTIQELLDTQKKEVDGYLSIKDAIRTSVIDIQSTQVALLKASMSMSGEVLEMLSPEKLIYQFEESGKLQTGLFRNASAWKNYKTTHRKISNDNTVMNSILHRSFLKNYEQQVRLIEISNGTKKY